MRAKRSGVLLVGLLLAGLLAGLSQTSDTKGPTCPPLEDVQMQAFLVNTSTWVRASWNGTTNVWDIRCSEMDSLANMPAYTPGGPLSNVNAVSNRPVKRRPHEE